MMEKKLMDLGLSRNEARIFIELTRSGSTLASDLARKTGFNRSDVYSRLDSLMARGLVGYVIKNKIKHFQSAPPESLIDYAKKREEEFKKKGKELKVLIKKLNNLSKVEIQENEVVLFKGRAGIKVILEDILRSLKDGSNLLAYGSDMRFYEMFRYYYPNFIKKRIKAGIKLFAVTSKNSTFEHELSEVRYLPGRHQAPVGTAIYSDKVAIFVMEELPSAILIKSKNIAKGYTDYFNWLWSISKKR